MTRAVLLAALVGLGGSAWPMAATAQTPDAPSDPVERQVHSALRGETPPIAEAKESNDVPARTIRVLVRDPAGAPVASADVEVGVLAQAGKREKKLAKTDGSGIATFSGLPNGTGQAYRVNVPFDGAVYSSTPFQLPINRGYEVTVTRLPVSRDSRFLLQFLMRVYVELRDGRMRITEQAQLANLGTGTFVFPKEGIEVALPKGHTAFQTQPGMGDQRLVEADKGFRIFGSIPPGRVTLMWAFDMPLAGTEFAFTQPVPFRTYRFSIEADGPPGSKLEVGGMLEAIEHVEKGHRFLVSQIQIEPDQPQITELDVRITGLPGPGPTRWIAVGLASLMLIAGVFLASRTPALRAARVARPEERDSILADAEALERDFKSGEVGPKFHARRMRELVEDLALVLKAESDSAAKQPPPGSPEKRG